MCGITAFFAYAGRAAPVDRDEVAAVTEQMRPRGPDAGDTWFSADGRVGLGSRRLAIIDLSAAATQPLHDVENELTIVFNGEIYNYAQLRAQLAGYGARFHTHSDTEVLLQMYRRYGEQMVELLRGMFSFAIWDARERRMFVARDPYGIKPLYVADDGATFRCASTVKALLAGGRIARTRDAGAAAGFFLLGSVPEPFTVMESIRTVEAGTSFFVTERGRSESKRLVSIAAVLARGAEQQSAAQLVEPTVLMRELVTESLCAHLVSDVPVGAFLSSGIDSTTLAALATEANRPPRCVTLQFAEYAHHASDEAPLAERFAQDRGLQQTTRLVTRGELLTDLPRIFEAMDQPTIDGVNTWFVSKAASEAGLKVAISGIGGDELFGSYSSFRDIPRLLRLSRTPGANRVVAGITRHPKARAVARYAGTIAGAYFLKRGLFLPEDLPAILGAAEAEEGLARLRLFETIERTLQPDPGTSFGRVAALEASMYMRNQLLRDTDWASMAHSLEVRTPLVDITLLRQIAPLLLSEKAKSKQEFSRSPRTPLPSYLRNRPKTGFSVPLAQWMNLPSDGTSTRMRSWARMVWERWS
jgi:asparagine synthase (glutamine-hydrolysing)